ncbi:mevalonate kinase [Bacteriovoracaceae bacterium]|nr:mevalonate kinase [Bacteriovoracaceae bacterium]
MVKAVTQSSFSSKVLLLGEYSIIKNSMALAMPYELFDGKLVFVRNAQGGGHDSKSLASANELKAFAVYIQNVLETKNLPITFDMTSFLFDIEHGLYFSSSIPEGYGLGSSAAVCSAVFHRYGVLTKISSEKEKIQILRNIFAVFESYFHGESSGIDPLISYLDGPILIQSNREIERVRLPDLSPNSKGGLFLLSTGRPRKTGPLVNLFLELCKREEFWNEVEKELIPCTNECIVNFLEGNVARFRDHFRTLSHFQFDHFKYMIPEEFQSIWRHGLRTGDYTFKLCGAGGGGFLLGLTDDFEKVKKIFVERRIRVVLSV